jgi:hypothetical protein
MPRQILDDTLPEHIKTKAGSIMDQIQGGQHWSRFGGKRLVWKRSMISIPVGYSYRIIAREAEGSLTFEKVVSHEAYNKLIGKR